MYFDKPHKIFAFEDIGISWIIFKDQITNYMSEFGFKSLSIYLFIISFVALIILFFYTIKKYNNLLKPCIAFTVVFSVGIMAAPIINGNYTGWDILRYNIYPFYLAGINMAIFLAITIKDLAFLKTSKYVTLIFSLTVFTIGMNKTSLKGLNFYFNYYPKEVAIIDSLAKKEGLLCGVSNYWLAKKTTMYSKNNVKVYSVFEYLAAYMHVSNQNWFFENKFDFIILNNFNDTTTYKQHIENPLITMSNDNLKLIKTNTFEYKKDKGYLPVIISVPPI